jgi:FkbM family methyltransferase
MTPPRPFIIEIGTCDFETQAGHVDGLFIEPVKEYFDSLPATCWKENVAVSNYTGSIDLYHIPAAVINERGLPGWLRGCNSVGKPHPTVEAGVRAGSIQAAWVVKTTVSVVRIKDLIAKYNITHIDLLKLDTEGHDAVILNDFFDTLSLRPDMIFFEHNGLVPEQDVQALITRLTQLDYQMHVAQGHCQAVLNRSQVTAV